MLSPKPAQKTRCRQIAGEDLDALAGLLAGGFERTTRSYWTAGFRRMEALPAIEGMPRFGYMLDCDGTPVGALLMISSMRGTRVFCNLSSWYVDPLFRSHSNLLVSMATKLAAVSYLNISPAPATWRLIEALGFTRYNDGRSAVIAALVPGGGAVSETVPGNLAEREMLLAHRGYGCVSLVCEKDGRFSPFIFRPRRLRFPPLKMMELIYCREPEDFAAHAGTLGRHLLRRGYAGVICDGRMPGLAGLYVPDKEPRFFKGPKPPLNDLAFTEKVIFET